MDTEELLDIAHHAYGSLGLDRDPEIGFLGVRLLRELADFCESYQVRRLREAGHSWAQIASLARVSPQALHKKHAEALKATRASTIPATHSSRSLGRGAGLLRLRPDLCDGR
jgi:hypothetical protein